MSYFAVPPELWPAIRERLPRPLSREEAIVDLRWWQDRELSGVEEMPAYRVLGASWGWSQSPQQDCKRARLLVADHLTWGDPLKLERWKVHRGLGDGSNKVGADSKGRNEGAGGAQRGRNEGANLNGGTPNINGKGRNEGADGAQRGRNEGDTRDPFPQTQTPVVVGGRAREAIVERLLQLQQREQPDQAEPPRDEAALNRAVGRGLSEEELQALWCWSGQSQDKQARACRSSRWRRWCSLLEGGEDPAARLSLAAAWDAAGRPAGKATGPPPQAARPAPAGRPRFSAADLLPNPTPSPGGAK